MKKRYMIMCALVTMMSLLSACGNKGINPDDYVTLGDYSNLTTEVTYVTFTEEDVENTKEEELAYYIDAYDLYDYVEDTASTTVVSGNFVNIDYVGTKDGTPFDGGTAEGFHLEIGGGKFIDGFEDGLIGANVGDTLDLNLTFPAEYQQPDLAGADVVFTVTVNSIDQRIAPEYNDELITKLGMSEITTLDGYLEGVREYLQQTCDSQNDLALAEAIWNTVYEVCEVSDPPQEMIDKITARIRANAETYATNYDVDFNTFITNYFGMTEEDFNANSLETATEEAKKELVYMAIAKQQDIEASDDKVQEYATKEYVQYGYESADAYIEGMGADVYKEYVLSELVNDYLETVVTVKENEPVSVLQNVQP